MPMGDERTFAWLSQFRRLRVRYEKRADIQRGILVSCMRSYLLALPPSSLDEELADHTLVL